MATSIIENLNAKSIWKNAGSATGTTAISLSNITYNELCIEVMIDNSINREYFYVPEPALASPTLYMRQGGYGTNASTESCYVVIGVSKNSVSLSSAIIFGNNKTSTSVTRVWYR